MRYGLIIVSLAFVSFPALEAAAGTVTFEAPVISNAPIPHIPADQIGNQPLVTQIGQVVPKDIKDLTLHDLGNLTPASDAQQGSGGTVVNVATVTTVPYTSHINNSPTSVTVTNVTVGGFGIDPSGSTINTSLQNTINNIYTSGGSAGGPNVVIPVNGVQNGFNEFMVRMPNSDLNFASDF